MKTYRAIIPTDPTAPIDPDAAVSLAATSPRDAACQALVSSPRDGHARRDFLAGRTIRVWVWDRSGPTYPNGYPICVHGIDLVRGPAGAGPSAEAPRAGASAEALRSRSY